VERLHSKYASQPDLVLGKEYIMARWSILVIALLLAVSSAKAEESDMPRIFVYGTATLQVAPNQMIWLLSVRNIDPTSLGAAKIHETTVAAVNVFLKQNQIEDKTIQKSRMQLGENWRYSSGETKQDGYFASTDIQFTLSDLARYSAIWIGLSSIQGVHVNDVSLGHSDRIQFQNEARTKAVLAARDKAKALAEILGARIGAPLNVEEDISIADGYRSQIPTTSNISIPITTPGTIDQPVEPGSIPIRARVKASFRLVAQ
jgi:uncharacterized protein YggE